MKYAFLALLGLSLLALVGCTYGSKVKIGGDSYAPVTQDKVQILLTAPTQPSHVIGMVTARGAKLASTEQVYAKLQKSAADLGADAVIVTEEAIKTYFTIPGHTDTHTTTSVTGTADTTGTATVYGNGNGATVNGQSTTNYTGQAQTNSQTTYTPPEDITGLEVRGLAIKFD